MASAIIIFILQEGKLFTCGLISFWPCLISFGLCVLWGDDNSHLGVTVPKRGCQCRTMIWEGKASYWESLDLGDSLSFCHG